MNTRDNSRAAMERLLAGAPEHTDGRLTRTNLALKAGIGRDPLGRHEDLVLEWKRRTAAVDISELTEPNTAVIAGLTR